ncbi:MAG: hypothetical protein ACOX6U_01110 [Oscillospiraceae bacterium]|jgi:hypothetical protein
MKQFCKNRLRIILGAMLTVLILTACTNDTVTDEFDARKWAYPGVSASMESPGPIPFEWQAKYADLIIEAEVLSINPVEPAVYTYREGDPGVGFMKWDNILQIEYDLLTFEVKVTAILKGQSRILLDCLSRPNLHHLAPTVKVAVPPALRGVFEENYTNFQVGNRMFLILMDYADGMYTPAAYRNSMYTIRNGTAYLPNYIPESYLSSRGARERELLLNRLIQDGSRPYVELVDELKRYLY